MLPGLQDQADQVELRALQVLRDPQVDRPDPLELLALQDLKALQALRDRAVSRVLRDHRELKE